MKITRRNLFRLLPGVAAAPLTVAVPVAHAALPKHQRRICLTAYESDFSIQGDEVVYENGNLTFKNAYVNNALFRSAPLITEAAKLTLQI